MWIFKLRRINDNNLHNHSKLMEIELSLIYRLRCMTKKVNQLLNFHISVMIGSIKFKFIRYLHITVPLWIIGTILKSVFSIMPIVCSIIPRTFWLTTVKMGEKPTYSPINPNSGIVMDPDKGALWTFLGLPTAKHEITPLHITKLLPLELKLHWTTDNTSRNGVLNTQQDG